MNPIDMNPSGKYIESVGKQRQPIEEQSTAPTTKASETGQSESTTSFSKSESLQSIQSFLSSNAPAPSIDNPERIAHFKALYESNQLPIQSNDESIKLEAATKLLQSIEKIEQFD